MKHFHLVAAGVDVAPVLAELVAQPELWNANRSRRDHAGSPHARMSDIWVRYNDPARRDPANPARFNDEHVPVWYPAWRALPSLRPVIFGLMREVQGEMLGGVLITRVPPGAGIAPHTDDGWHVQYYDKFYLSLASEPGAAFVCADRGVTEALEPAPGEVWLFDNRKPHWVENNSSADRITLIVCIRTELFGRA